MTHLRAPLVAALAAICTMLFASSALAAPTFTLSEPAEGAYVGNNLSVNGYAPAGTTLTSATCAFTNSWFAGGNSCLYMDRWISVGYSISAVPDGPQTLTVQVTDGTGTKTIVRNVIKDTLAPTTYLNSGPSNTTINSTSATWSFSASEGGSFRCQIDGGAFSVCTSPFPQTGLSDGNHTFQVQAVDNAGNVDQSPVSAAFTVYTGPPTAVIQSGPDGSGAVTTRTPQWTFTSLRSDALYECSLDSAAWVACDGGSFGPDLPGLSDGDHTFAVRAFLSGPTSVQDPATYVSFTVDATAPTVTVSGTAAVGGSAANFTYGADESVNHYICVLDPDGADDYFEPCPTSFDNLVAGQHTLVVVAVDLAGNETSEANATLFHWTQYPNLPETTIVSKPDPAVAAASAGFKFSSPTGVAYECSIDGGPFSTCAAEFTVSGLAGGSHTLQVRAKDPAGQLDASPDSAVFTLLAPPETTPSAPNLQLKSLTTKAIKITVTDAGRVQVTVSQCKSSKSKKASTASKRKRCKKVTSGSAKSSKAGSVKVNFKKKLKKGTKYSVTVTLTTNSGAKTTVTKTLKAK